MNQEDRTIKITTGARIHFGLLDVHPPFGGMGVMIQDPATTVWSTPPDPNVAARTYDTANNDSANDDSANNDSAEIIARVIGRIKQERAIPKQINIHIDAHRRRHQGLGSGTQCAMAIAEIVARTVAAGVPQETIQRWSGRGRRSRVGSIGYFRGGLIAETGESFDHVALPEDWKILVATPLNTTSTVSGTIENENFERLESPDPAHRLELDELFAKLLESAKRHDFERFSEWLFRYNRSSGKLFSPVQSGVYKSRSIRDLVNRIERLGFRGVGQSSWGPGVFAFCRHQSDAVGLATELEGHAKVVTIASIQNGGRVIE